MASIQPRGQSLAARCGILAAAVVALWIVLAGPAWLMAGTAALEGLSYAAVLCLLPGWVVFAIASRARESNRQATVTILGGMGLRMLFVLGGMLGVQAMRPHLGLNQFVVWLLIYYVATVALETLMVVSGLKRSQSGSETT
ncbi:MAG: hypothetical protein ACE5KM_01720 [Planctomycetaceae bacterium]